ncbi:MAG: tetratricopeptide repeat protein [Candidatus Krumholzibacteriota bacterium]
MKCRPLFIAVVSLLVFSGCSQHRIQTVASTTYSSDGSHLAPVLTDTVTFEQELEGHLVMPDSVQTEIRALAEEELVDWREFEKEVQDSYDALYRSWYQEGNVLPRVHRGVGLGNSLVALGKATAIDPSFVEAWTARGRLACEAGDVHTGLESLDAARVAADVCREYGQPVSDEIQLEIYRERAWALRDLTLWDEGLAAVQEGLEFHHGDRDLVLIKGLLLAGAGRYSEAVSLAVRMPPLRYPKYGLLNMGLEMEESAYGNLWIKSQALLAIGDYEMAFALFGDMELYPYRGVLVHSARFWKDLGLVAELAGSEDAPVYYAIGYITREYDRYYPVGAFSLGPMVLDVPDDRMPCYTSFGMRFHVAGSPLSYIALQMNQMSLGIFEDQKIQAAGRALRALEIAERRHIRPEVCRALRGRIYYAGDDFPAAHTELKAARETFRTQGEVDSGTSLLLGMLELQGNRYQPAARYLEEAVEKDPTSTVGWRSLGVVYVNLGLSDKALAAMDTALELQPNSVSGLYNRGLFHYQANDYTAAAADLDKALIIDPENREVQRLLKMAGQGHIAMGGDAEDLPASSRDLGGEAPNEETVTGFEVDPDLLLSQLQADIETFFTVPDSLAEKYQHLDSAIAEMEAAYRLDGDIRTRKMLALAYIDNKEMAKAQALLAPGWGVDLEPDEEIMLLYADRMLGEQERARLLADQLVSGEISTNNPYVWAMSALAIRDDPRAVDDSLVNAMFKGKMYYGLASTAGTDITTFGYTMNMLYGFSNLRAAHGTKGVYMYPRIPWILNEEHAQSSSGKGISEPLIK